MRATLQDFWGKGRFGFERMIRRRRFDVSELEMTYFLRTFDFDEELLDAGCPAFALNVGCPGSRPFI
jgi:hypothetical protein